MKKTILAFLTAAVNRYVQMDPESIQHLQKLNGNCIAIELLPLEFVFYFVFNANHIEITTEEPQDINVQIAGTPIAFAAAMLNHAQNDLEIEGQAETAQAMLNLLTAVQIDWEELISKIIGDHATHTLSQFAKQADGWLKKSAETMATQINEYVHEEKEWLPSREALQDFFNEVDEIKMTVERIDARIQKMTEALQVDPQNLQDLK